MVMLSAASLHYSCQKSADQYVSLHKISTASGSTNSAGQRVIPYKFERINDHNFSSQGWREQQVNIVNGITFFSDSSAHVNIVCGPENNSDPRLIPGSVTMNLPTAVDPTLRRIRLRKAGYSGTLLDDLTELKYSTYVVQKAPTILVLQVDFNGDGTRDYNIYYDPQPIAQPSGFTPIVLNTWQQWDALNEGVWHIEGSSSVSLPGGLADLECTIPELVAAFPNAGIIDTPPVGHNGEGVRFTIGGTPRNLFDNTIGYFDALIIGTKNEQVSTLYDFVCNQGNN